jgi:hypothetical protein
MAKSCRHFKSFHAAPRRFALLTGPWGRTGKVRYEPTSYPHRKNIMSQLGKNFLYQVLTATSLILLLLPLSALSSTFYVTKTGNDENSCTKAKSQNTAKLTIQAGINCAIAAGDSVLVKSGTYLESVTLWKSGVSGKPITLKAYPGDAVIWRAPTTDTDSLIGAISIMDSSYIRIEGFTFDGTRARATVRILNTSGNKTINPIRGVEIIRNTFTDNGSNTNVSKNLSRVLYLQHIGNDHTYTGSPTNTVSDNIFSANYGSDIYLLGTTDTLVRNNTSIYLKSSQDRWNNNWFIARSIFVGADANNIASRNIIESNSISYITRDSYVTTMHEGAGIRFDVDAGSNTIFYNIIHSINKGQPEIGGKTRAFGIYLENRSGSNEIRGNTVYDIAECCYRDGSKETPINTSNKWISNIGYNCGQCGMSLSHAQSAVVKNNIFMNGGQAQIFVSDSSVRAGGHIFRNNDYFKMGTSTIGVWNSTQTVCANASHTLLSWGKVSGDTNSLSVDPKFVNAPSNFRLQSGSPVATAGESGVAMGAHEVSMVLSPPTNP